MTTKTNLQPASKCYSFLRRILTENFFFFYLCSAMLLVPLTEFIYETRIHPYVSQPYLISIIGIIGAAAVCGWFLAFQQDPNPKLSHLFFWTLFLFSFFALILSLDKDSSMGGFDYAEWFSHYLAYYSLFFAGAMIRSSRKRKIILFLFIFLAFGEGILGFFQSLGFFISPAYLWATEHHAHKLVYGLTQHQNYYAGLSILFDGACLGAMIFSDSRKKLILASIAFCISFYASISTSARIAWVGNFALLCFFGVSFLVMRKNPFEKENIKKYRNRFLLVLLFAILILGIILLTTNKLQEEAVNTIRQSDISSDSFANSRGYIWKVGLATVPKNWWHGIGLNNYHYAFTIYPGWKEGMFSVYRGHNEYIHTLVTQGVFALINYLVLLVYVGLSAVKHIRRTEDAASRRLTWIFLGMFAGYACQALFNSSVINTAMYFWITLGMCIPVSIQKTPEFIAKRKKCGVGQNINTEAEYQEK